MNEYNELIIKNKNIINVVWNNIYVNSNYYKISNKKVNEEEKIENNYKIKRSKPLIKNDIFNYFK